MRIPRRTRAWIVTSWVVALLVLGGLASYMASVGLDRASKIGSAGGLLVALLAIVVPYLLPSASSSTSTGDPRPGPAHRVGQTGGATAAGGGVANSGLDVATAAQGVDVRITGTASANGPGSFANTGAKIGPPPRS